MEHMTEIDGQAEADGRRLLTAAFETTGPGDGADGFATGAELLRQVRRRTSRQRRTARALVPAGAVTALGAAAGAAVTLTATVASAPSAAAAVTAAAGKMSGESFRMTMGATSDLPAGIWGPSHNVRNDAHVTGEFDLSRGVGEESVSGGWQFRVLVADRHTYVHTDPGSPQVVFPAGNPSKPWWEFPTGPALTPTPIAATGDQIGATPVGPAALLGLLKSAGSVTDEGPASGPGWTGTKYGFRVTEGRMTAAGYVDVDRHGLVRRLVTTLRMKLILVRYGAPGTKPVERPGPTVTDTEDVTFSDFGTPVSVSAPAAGQVDRLKGPAAIVGFGW